MTRAEYILEKYLSKEHAAGLLHGYTGEKRAAAKKAFVQSAKGVGGLSDLVHSGAIKDYAKSTAGTMAAGLGTGALMSMRKKRKEKAAAMAKKDN